MGTTWGPRGCGDNMGTTWGPQGCGDHVGKIYDLLRHPHLWVTTWEVGWMVGDNMWDHMGGVRSDHMGINMEILNLWGQFNSV